MVSPPDLSIIIVSWNGRDDLVRCLEAVDAARGQLDLQVIVVDNASQDDTVAVVRESFPHVTLIDNDLNVGFPRANNQGLARATGRHVFLLNPDTEVGVDVLRECVGTLDADPEVGAVGCRLVYPGGLVQDGCARRAYRLIHLLWEAFYLHVLFPRNSVFAHQVMGNWDHSGVRDVEAISGAAFMVRRHLLEEVGGLPEELFMYHEDLSLCLKIQARGFRIRYRGDVTTVHYHGQSSGRSSLDLHLLDGPVRVELITERSGALAGLAARGLFGFRSITRLGLALIGRIIPGIAHLRAERPKAFDVALQWDQLLWTLFPRIVVGRMPVPPPLEPLSTLLGGGPTAADL